MLANLDHIPDLGVVEEALHVQNEHARELIDQHLLRRIEECTRPRRDGDLHWLWMRDVAYGFPEGGYVLGLNVELQRSPVLDRGRVALGRCVQCRAEFAPEDACDR